MTNMKTLYKAVISLVLAFVGLTPAFATTSLTQTTLAAGVSRTSDTIHVASTTGITVSGGTTATGLYIDNEYLVVLAVDTTSGFVKVSRGQAGTRSNAHLSGAIVLAGPPRAFYNTDPSGAAGYPAACTNAAYTPYINIITGNQWLCSTVLNKWVPGWGNPGNSGTPIAVTAAVASAAGTITPSGPLFHVTGALAITGFVIPIGYNGGPFCIIPDGNFTTTTAGNIALASTAVTSKQLCYAYDANAAKPFFPSY
jgi:hypothetical protein